MRVVCVHTIAPVVVRYTSAGRVHFRACPDGEEYGGSDRTTAGHGLGKFQMFG